MVVKLCQRNNSHKTSSVDITEILHKRYCFRKSC